jgi:hypothetical protein
LDSCSFAFVILIAELAVANLSIAAISAILAIHLSTQAHLILKDLAGFKKTHPDPASNS